MGWSERLWGKNAKLTYLLLAALLVLLTCLGTRDIWTQEHRWADIVYAMFYNHDFLHPSLNGNDYYDKPLLSYWFIAGFAILMGKLSTWAMRLPSALAGVLAVWSIYRLGTRLKDRQLGLLSGWILLTTFYFIFWARTSSADMLNMAGTLFAVTWYFERKSHPNFFTYAVFFLILAVTALCKGLVGPVVTVLAILPDLFMRQEWKRHLRLSLIAGLIPAAILYALPFWASTHFGVAHYQENGLYLVYRENILRYFQPFDHKGPIYTYFLFLPVYLLPWTLFFIPALFAVKSRWKTMSDSSKWVVMAVVVLFAFFTLSGSRRSYYILPLVPFAILLTADWILAGVESAKRDRWSGRLAVLFFGGLFLNFVVIQPIYYGQSGVPAFAEELKHQAEITKPWADWNVVMLDPESKLRFYLDLSPVAPLHNLDGSSRYQQTAETLLHVWPMLKNPDPSTIYVSRKAYEPILKSVLKDYTVIEANAGLGQRLFKKKNADLPIAFIPKTS